MMSAKTVRAVVGAFAMLGGLAAGVLVVLSGAVANWQTVALPAVMMILGFLLIASREQVQELQKLKDTIPVLRAIKMPTKQEPPQEPPDREA